MQIPLGPRPSEEGNCCGPSVGWMAIGPVVGAPARERAGAYVGSHGADTIVQEGLTMFDIGYYRWVAEVVNHVSSRWTRVRHITSGKTVRPASPTSPEFGSDSWPPD